MLRFFSRGFNDKDIHLVNGTSIQEEFKPLKSSKPNYGSLTRDLIKIKPFSLCSSASSAFQNKLANISETHINERQPTLSPSTNH